jgi:hypothetical protein
VRWVCAAASRLDVYFSNMCGSAKQALPSSASVALRFVFVMWLQCAATPVFLNTTQSETPRTLCSGW